MIPKKQEPIVTMSNNGKRTKFLRELKNLVTPNLLPRSAKRNLDGKPRFDDAKHIGTACNLNAKFDNQLDNYGARDDGDRIVVDNNIDDRAGNTVEKKISRRTIATSTATIAIKKTLIIKNPAPVISFSTYHIC